MFERYMLCDDTFRAAPDGFEIELRIPYYRGIRLSLVDKLEVRLDGELVPADNIVLELRGRRFRLDELPAETVERWEFGERAKVHVRLSDPLTPGNHRISVTMTLRISYMPVPSVTSAQALVAVG
jgi:hypothetical protein